MRKSYVEPSDTIVRDTCAASYRRGIVDGLSGRKPDLADGIIVPTPYYEGYAKGNATRNILRDGRVRVDAPIIGNDRPTPYVAPAKAQGWIGTAERRKYPPGHAYVWRFSTRGETRVSLERAVSLEGIGEFVEYRPRMCDEAVAC